MTPETKQWGYGSRGAYEELIGIVNALVCLEPTKVLIHGETKNKVRLTETETSILKYLYRSGLNVVGRDILLEEVWGYSAGVITHTLETHVYRLR